MKAIIVFASGCGSNFEALAEACKSGYIDGKIILLVAGKAGIGAIEKAKKFDIPVFVAPPSPQPSPTRGEGEREYSSLPQGARVKELACHADKKQSSRNDNAPASLSVKNSPLLVKGWQAQPDGVFGEGLVPVLKNLKPDLICLAGYLKKIPQEVLGICPVMNIHPALLPGFGGKGMYGHHVHEAVLKSGNKESGATVHFVNGDYDKGQIIKQVKVPVLPDDTPQTLATRILKEEHKLYPLCVKLFCEGKL